MEPLIWHKNRRFYWAGDYPIYARRLPGRCWAAGYNSILNPDQDAAEAWAQRNDVLWNTRFTSLTELKAVVEAVLAVDPVEKDPIISARYLQREAPGVYQVRLGEIEIRVVRDESGDWRIFREDRLVGVMVTLFSARAYITGMCRTDLLRSLSVS